MSEVKREFYIHLDEDRAAAFAWRSLDAANESVSFNPKTQERIHVVNYSWHEQEMERMGAAYDGVSSRHRELMNDFNRVADAKSHLSSQVLEQQLKVDSLTAMLDKANKRIEELENK